MYMIIYTKPYDNLIIYLFTQNHCDNLIMYLCLHKTIVNDNLIMTFVYTTFGIIIFLIMLVESDSTFI